MYINIKYTIVARRFVYELCKEKDLDYTEMRTNILKIPETSELVIVKDYKDGMVIDRYQNIYDSNDELVGFYDELGEVFTD